MRVAAAPFLVRSAGGVAEGASQAAEDLQGKRQRERREREKDGGMDTACLPSVGPANSA